MFCNGMWCGQSPNNIANLLKFGYPPTRSSVPRGHAGLGDPGTHHRSGRLTAPADAAMGGGPAAHRRPAP